MDNKTSGPHDTPNTTPEEGENVTHPLFNLYIRIGSLTSSLTSSGVPCWKTPVMSFLHENCIVFDNDDENKLEYT